MVLKKKSLNKKVTKVKKSIKSKKPAPRLTPAPLRPLAWKSLFPTNANLEQCQSFLSGDWEFDTKSVLQSLGEIYSKDSFKLYLFLGNEMHCPADGGTPHHFPVLNVLIVPSDLNEPPPFLLRKAYDGNDEEIMDLHALKLGWKATTKFAGSGQFKTYALMCARSFDFISKLPEASRYHYEYAKLMDCRESKAFPLNRRGELAVEDVEFRFTPTNGTEVVGYYWNAQSLSDFIDDFIEEKGLENDETTQQGVKAAIKQAVVQKRSNIKSQRERVYQSVSDTSLLEEVKCAKIYPSNMTESEIGRRTPQLESTYTPADHVF